MRNIVHHAGVRPRVEGARESEILDAALAVLGEVGYDRLTMDAVATRAHASKATLYRRWPRKSTLVVDAIIQAKHALQSPDVDTGNLRDDLVAMACCVGGLAEDESAKLMAGVVTALHRDTEFGDEFRQRVVGPKLDAVVGIFERARVRGEIDAGLDLDLLAPALAGIILHRSFVLGLPPDEQTVARVVDEIILPAATRPTKEEPAPKNPR